jgi:hypothetical protein
MRRTKSTHVASRCWCSLGFVVGAQPASGDACGCSWELYQLNSKDQGKQLRFGKSFRAYVAQELTGRGVQERNIKACLFLLHYSCAQPQRGRYCSNHQDLYTANSALSTPALWHIAQIGVAKRLSANGFSPKDPVLAPWHNGRLRAACYRSVTECYLLNFFGSF